MKLRMYIEINASKSIIDTIKRNGFTLEKDGSSARVVVPNAPTIPRRKVNIKFLDGDSDGNP